MRYQISDEPQPGRLGHLVARPSAPLLASMVCGAWLAWPWFVFNAIAMGSPTRRKEGALVGAAFAGTVVLALGLWWLLRAGLIDSEAEVRLALLAIATWKLGTAYLVCIVQTRTFHVYEYYGGTVRSSYAVLLAGYWLRPILLGLSASPFWKIVLAGGV